MVTIPHLKNLHVTPHSAPAKSIRPGSTPQPWRSCWSPRCSCCRPTAAVANAPRTAGPKPTASDPRGNRRWWWRHSQGFLPGTWWTKLWITGYTHIFRKKRKTILCWLVINCIPTISRFYSLTFDIIPISSGWSFCPHFITSDSTGYPLA